MDVERRLRIGYDASLRRMEHAVRRMQRDLTERRIRSAARLSASRPRDIFIASYPKSGTTWVQMILYQLTTAGDMNFTHISQISPSLEATLLHGASAFQSSSATQFKTHGMPDVIPHGPGKCIYVLRHGLDVACSYFHHFRRFNNYQDSFEAFFRRFLIRGSLYPSCNWFTHVREWCSEDRHDVLRVHYEDLIDDLAASVGNIASFCGIPLSPTTMERVLTRCSFTFMRAHERLFDPMPHINCTGGDDSHFIRSGIVGGSNTILTDNIFALYRTEFDRVLGSCGLLRYRDRVPERFYRLSTD